MNSRILIVGGGSGALVLVANELALKLEASVSATDFQPVTLVFECQKSIPMPVNQPFPHCRDTRRQQQPFYRGLKKYRKP